MYRVTPQDEADLKAYREANPEFAAWVDALQTRAAATEAAEHEVLPEPDAGVALDLVPYVHGYYNNQNTGGNACGQAAIATILDYHNYNPYNLPKPVYDSADGKYHFDNDAIINRIRAQFGPDIVAGLLGTSGGRIADALRAYGMRATCSYSGAATAGWDRIWASVKNWVSANHPVICIIDCGKIGGTPFTAHWAVVYNISGGRVHFANWGSPSSSLTEAEFTAAWHCWFLPPGFNHCTIFPQR